MWDFILNAFVSYLKAHPDKIEALIDELVNALIANIKKSNA